MTQKYENLLNQGREALTAKDYTLACKCFLKAREALRDYAMRRYLSAECDLLEQLLKRAHNGFLSSKKNREGA
ncbi:hypothetical protein [Microcystis phage Mvi-JY20]|uniref:Uncharacterized protein n=1 Tax=Microcystis phage Mvi-JY20 TaxID=3128146 RepID=A0AAX4QGT4_9CAUD